MNTKTIVTTLCAVGACIGLAQSALAQSSELYMFKYDGAQGNFHVFQNGSSIRSWAGTGNGGPAREYGLAVADDVRTVDYFGSNTGAQYDLNGVPSGTTYTHGISAAAFIDGTTNGTNANYAGDYFSDKVYGFDRNWANPTVLFQLGGGIISGITYDGVNNSLWIYRSGSGVVGEYALDGTMKSSFDVDNVSTDDLLAYEPSTETIWLKPRDLQEIRQFSRAGDLLATVALTGYGNDTLGMEFAQKVPTPGAAGLLGLGGLMIGRRRR